MIYHVSVKRGFRFRLPLHGTFGCIPQTVDWLNLPTALNRNINTSLVYNDLGVFHKAK